MDSENRLNFPSLHMHVNIGLPHLFNPTRTICIEH